MHFSESKAKRKTVLKVKFKVAFVSWYNTRERIQERMHLPLSVSVEAIQVTSEILIFAGIDGQVSKFVWND